MIWSVSMLSFAKGTATERSRAKGSISRTPARRRTSVMRPVTAAAAAMAGLIRCVRAPGPCRPRKLRLEVEATRSPRGRDLAIGAEAHGAAGLAPVEAGLAEDAVQPLRLRLALHRRRSRHHPGGHASRDAAAARDGGGGAQILDAGIGAGADEDAVHRDLLHGRPAERPM